MTACKRIKTSRRRRRHCSRAGTPTPKTLGPSPPEGERAISKAADCVRCDGRFFTEVSLYGNEGGAADGARSVARFATPAAIAIGKDGDLSSPVKAAFLSRRVTAAGESCPMRKARRAMRDGAPGAAQLSSLDAIVATNGDLCSRDVSLTGLND